MPTDSSTSRRNTTNSTLQRGLLLLEAVATAPHGMSAADLERRLEIPKPTLHRLLKQLEEQEFVIRDLEGRHLLPGERLHCIAMGVLSNERLKAPRRILLKRLADEVGETCNLTLLDGHEVMYYERVETNWPVRIQLPPGSRLPIHCTASGKLFLALMPPHQRRLLLQHLPLEAHTPYTATTADDLESRLETIVSQELSTDDEEFIQGMVAVAVPVYDQAGRMQATLAIHAPRLRHTIESLKEWAPLMRRIASELQDTLWA
ncbi:IclR family transcriptional regulator [Halomonas sp. KAO]|uniref:IclR family transcriptional regulator n=1 Tax=unclassified Halomonas TaxID=2609666 RepID=UPI00189EFD49|nr:MULTISPECIES: IclR family transcriptional regulator [unclassified Halomonas]MBF7052908.1 IclR family transcriptional regulator [Halomonas sp. KAO]MDT0501556.1 IclR family transcriptional regulator [Halomonas sp. PAR7]MDT0511087.1 IclR family transcriptional regulator [Halomonas sp. LES1]MDT0592396.1 IclR family transcriptional regulator [Halomonas sp. PAR8]